MFGCFPWLSEATSMAVLRAFLPWLPTQPHIIVITGALHRSPGTTPVLQCHLKADYSSLVVVKALQFRVSLSLSFSFSFSPTPSE